MPDAFGTGEFRATMNIFTDVTYRTPYIDPPIMNPEETLFVGETQSWTLLKLWNRKYFTDVYCNCLSFARNCATFV